MRGAGGTVIAAESRRASACNSANASIGSQLPDAVIVGIRYIKVAAAVGGDSFGLAEDAGRGRPSIPGVRAASHRGDGVYALGETTANPRREE